MTIQEKTRQDKTSQAKTRPAKRGQDKTRQQDKEMRQQPTTHWTGKKHTKHHGIGSKYNPPDRNGTADMKTNGWCRPSLAHLHKKCCLHCI